MMNWLRTLLAATTLAGLLAACGGGDDDPAPAPVTIAETAQRQNLTALLAAANKAGLSATLASPAVNVTVFAPTNAAFDTLATRLGFANAGAMVTALPASALADILNYHVLPTRQSAAQLSTGAATRATAYTFDGSPATLAVSTAGGGVRLTDAVLTEATVTAADVAATNGVVHVIDKVLVPPGVLNVVQMAQANPQFSTLVGAVVTANLATTLSGAGPFTVFAPTNQAFADIASTVAGLTTPQLTTVLTYHVIGSQVLASQIPFGTPVTTVSGQQITVENGPLRIVDTTATPAPIAATDIRASNGVIHVISKVLIPAL